MDRVFIGIGSNLSDREKNIEKSIQILRGDPCIELKKCSSLYLTSPVGKVDQPDFINCVVEIDTTLDERELLEFLLSIEDRLGRRRGTRWGARIIDLDILLYSDKVIKRDDLEIPHPRMHERLFVLQPLVELAPEVIHPVRKVSIRKLFEEVEKGSEEVVERLT